MRENWPIGSAPLNMRWWCEARIDIMMGYSDATFEAIRRAGCAMIFFGAESGFRQGSERDEQRPACRRHPGSRLAHPPLWHRSRIFHHLREPPDPEGDTADCIKFIRQLKRLNPVSEIVVEHYTPVPQRAKCMAASRVSLSFPKPPTNGQPTLAALRNTERSENSMAEAQHQAVDRQL